MVGGGENPPDDAELPKRTPRLEEDPSVELELVVEGSKEMVFLRPRLVVPGTFGPVDDDVYLINSVSDGRRSDSNMEGLEEMDVTAQ